MGRSGAVENIGHASASDAAKAAASASDVASRGRIDAVSAGIVKRTDDQTKEAMGPRRGRDAGGPKRRPAGRDAAASKAQASTRLHKATAAYAAAHATASMADGADGSDDDRAPSAAGIRSNPAARKGSGAKATEDGATRASKAAPAKSRAAAGTKGKGGKAAKAERERRKARAAKARMQSRRTWLKARAAQEAQTKAAMTAAVRKGAGAKLAAPASTMAAPAAGALCGILFFVLAALLVSQLVSAIFGFWDNEARAQAIEGLPPYITADMVETALECQEAYGHPAGCTIAQIICESGMGDHLSGQATQDNNLFGIKWASSFASCPEVTGKSSWSTGEEYGGEHVTIMADFTSFKSYRDCIVFRSRVLLQNERYAGNSLIQRAIAEHDSDLMAEGLKDAGYATSSSYVDSLKTVMDTYGLRRFDTMTLQDWKDGTASGNAIVAAATTQLGVPYVWGGSTPGVGLDCSGLTQWCYAQAGISIPRTADDQAAAGTKIPLSQARPGDILWRPGHVAIFAGGDEYIHEPHSGAVCTRASGIAYFTCAVRFR